MTKLREKSEEIRHFILNNVTNNPNNISKVTEEKFDLTRQAVNRHLQSLVKSGALVRKGQTRNRSYQLAVLSEWAKLYVLDNALGEDRVWLEDIKPALGSLPDNVLAIWQHGFTEMLNNAIDHSEGQRVYVTIEKTATETIMTILDDGVGIFKKIKQSLGLYDESHAVLELAKGKFTTDPRRHSGEGIFFTSRMFDRFVIISGGIHFSHNFNDEKDWIQSLKEYAEGTYIIMKLDNHTARRKQKVFDQYTSGDNFGFNKTVIPINMAQYGDDKLISRSQAKRVLARVELFKVVYFDFKDVPEIGQAFADEIFRVFAQQHPEIQITAINANKQVRDMVERAQNNKMGADV